MVEENPLFEHLLPSVRATATPGYDPETDHETPFPLSPEAAEEICFVCHDFGHGSTQISCFEVHSKDPKP